MGWKTTQSTLCAKGSKHAANLVMSGKINTKLVCPIESDCVSLNGSDAVFMENISSLMLSWQFDWYFKVHGRHPL